MICHRDSLLLHLRALGLRLNGQKSVLTPAQQTLFLGVCLDSTSKQARLAPARVESIQSCTARFKLGQHVSVGLCRRLLGLMAAASPVLPLGLLHMRTFLLELGGMTKNLYHGIFLNYTGFTVYDGIYFFHA